MSDLISREPLKQRINLNYNNHQYIDTQSIKDIINTESSVEDKTVEELEKIKREIHDIKLELDCDYYTGDKITRLIEKHIEELKGKTE